MKNQIKKEAIDNLSTTDEKLFEEMYQRFYKQFTNPLYEITGVGGYDATPYVQDFIKTEAKIYHQKKLEKLIGEIKKAIDYGFDPNDRFSMGYHQNLKDVLRELEILKNK